MAIPILIRAAQVTDLDAINTIYNYYVLHSTCTYQTEPETRTGRSAWFAQHGPRHPVLVAECAGAVVGWGSLSPFHPRSAYAHTVENSVYVQHDQHRQGIGSRLLGELITQARTLGHHAMVALIDADQPGSLALHKRHGFTPAGHLVQVGHKFGRWLDVIYMQQILS
jgi:L-amino acid N-acyltransferase YncA